MRNERGGALLVSLALIGMLFIVGVMAVNNAVNEIDMSYNATHSEKAFYIAEAGANQAFCELQADSSWRAGFADMAFGGGDFTVTLTDSSTNAALVDTVIVVSTGNANESRSSVELTLVPDVTYPFKKAMFADNMVDIRNSFITDSYNSDSGTYATTRDVVAADVGSNGNIYIANGAFVGGDVTTSLVGGTDVNIGATVTGTISDVAPVQVLPEIPPEEWAWAEAVNDAATGITGSYSYDSVTHSFSTTSTVVLSSGVYFFSDIVLSNTASITLAPGAEVTIYVTGDMELKNSASINPGGDPGDVMINSQGDFLLKNSGDIAAVFYSPDGLADLRNSGDFYGSIVTEDIICHNSANFHYDRDLGNIKREGEKQFLLVAFREL